MTSDPLLPASPCLTSEDTVPERERWWKERVSAWAATCEGVTPLTRRTYDEHVSAIPAHFVRLGFEHPTPETVTRDMVEAYALDSTLAPTTRAMNLGLLRAFLEHEGVELASRRRLWRGPARVATRRSWPTNVELAALLNAAHGRERVVVALTGFNGLRSDEIRRLRVRDCQMDLSDPRLAFRGKGDKLRNIAMSRPVWTELRSALDGKRAGDLVYPFKRTTIDRDVKRACESAGLRAYAPHDLRRGFARTAYEAGVPLVVIQNVLGHSDVGLTSYYIGANELAMREGMVRFSDHVEAALVGSNAGKGLVEGCPEKPVSGLTARQFPDVPARWR